MEFTDFEKGWIRQLVEGEFYKQKEQGHVFEADKEAFESILEKLKRD